MNKNVGIVALLLVLSGSYVYAQPSSGKKIQGQINQLHQSGKISTGGAIGLSVLNGLSQMAEHQNHHHPPHPGSYGSYGSYHDPYHRPPYHRPPQIQTVYVRPPATTTAATTATPAIVQTQTAHTVATQSPTLVLTPNPTAVTVKKLPKDVIRKIEKELKKIAVEIWEPIADELETATLNEDKAASLAQTLIDEGKDKKKIAELLVAIENGEADVAAKLISEMTDDPLAGNKVSKEIKFGVLLSEIEDQLAEGSFDASDISSWKKDIAKMKLPSKQQKIVNKGLDALKDVLELIEIFNGYKENAKLNVTAPIGPVSIIYCPSLSLTSAYALDEGVYIAGTDEDYFWTDEDYLSMLNLPPTYAVTPIVQTKSDVNSTTIINDTEQTATYYLDDNAARKLTPGTQATFDTPRSATVSLNSGGRKRPFTVKAGKYYLSYDGNNAWSLKQSQLTVTLDNSENPLSVECFVNRSPHTVSAGGRLDMKIDGGIIDIQFARDENISNAARYQFDSNGTYKIGICKQDGKWALFPENAVPETRQ